MVLECQLWRHRRPGTPCLAVMLLTLFASPVPSGYVYHLRCTAAHAPCGCCLGLGPRQDLIAYASQSVMVASHPSPLTGSPFGAGGQRLEHHPVGEDQLPDHPDRPRAVVLRPRVHGPAAAEPTAAPQPAAQPASAFQPAAQPAFPATHDCTLANARPGGCRNRSRRRPVGPMCAHD